MKFLKSLFSNAPTYQQQVEARLDAETARLQQVNAEKRAKSVEFLGDKWLLHPSNKVKSLSKCLTLHP